MKVTKSLILASATMFAGVGAQAADLPVKVKPIEYVKVCSLYGVGFYYIPGTDTCMRIGGYLRIDTTLNGGIQDKPAWNGALGFGDRTRNDFETRSRLGLQIDTRTATEYGVVRTFAELLFNFNTDNGLSGTQFFPDALFVQFAGFTIGASQSAYSTPWGGFPGNNTSYLVGGHDSYVGLNNIQYQAQFGNGVSATIGLDDPLSYQRTNLWNLANGLDPIGNGTNAYAGAFMPDVVGNIRIDQAWGLFQVSGALHEARATYNTIAGTGGLATPTSILSGHPETKYGGSAMVALQIKNIPTGPGDDIKLDASWAKGDMKNIYGTASTPQNFAMLGGVPGQFGPNNSIGFGSLSDGVYLPKAVAFGGVAGDGQIHLTEGFGIRGAFNHNWDPHWSSALYGGAMWVRHDAVAKAEWCAAYGATVAGRGVTYTCNPDYSASVLGLLTRWTPVKGLTFSAEATWFHLNQNFTGSATFTPGSGQPLQSWTYHNQDTLSFNVRVQRNF
ncbi:porin [Bradyrhizobium sp. CSA112]|uniref:porin n=1 Tax=Bradyrhizobium sp. CSA112 TaxID=2699170 RepID=UPI0023AFDA29|nr:porin [Bradyrhizobium sp. CSA112]MDE5458960.1 porin [Bradyrhizobium sp. CSA112]